MAIIKWQMGPMDLDIFIENKKLIIAFIWRFSGFVADLKWPKLEII